MKKSRVKEVGEVMGIEAGERGVMKAGKSMVIEV